MVTLTYGQKQAFCDLVAQFIKDNIAELKKAGLDPTRQIAELEKVLQTSVEYDAEQEVKKVQLRKATDKAVGSVKTAYKIASSLIDAMVGVYGKGSQMAKRLRKLREQMANVAARGKRTPEPAA